MMGGWSGVWWVGGRVCVVGSQVCDGWVAGCVMGGWSGVWWVGGRVCAVGG